MTQISPSWPTPHDISQTDVWAEPLVSGLDDLTTQGNANDLRIGVLESGGTGGVDSVNGKTGVVVLTKSDVGLPNVDNTSDASKPVSSPQATALATKVTIPTGGVNGQMIVKDTTQAAGFAYQTPSSGGTTSDATTTSKGIVQLAGDLTGTAAAPTLASSGVTAGTYGSSTQIPQLTVDAKGRVTAAANVASAGGGGAAVDNGDGVGTLGVVGTGIIGTNSITGTSYTVVLADAGNVVEQNSANPLVVTFPTDASQAIPIGSVVEFRLYGTGSITLQGATGVSLLSPNGLRLTTQYATAAAAKRSANEWIVSGYTVV